MIHDFNKKHGQGFGKSFSTVIQHSCAIQISLQENTDTEKVGRHTEQQTEEVSQKLNSNVDKEFQLQGIGPVGVSCLLDSKLPEKVLQIKKILLGIWKRKTMPS